MWSALAGVAALLAAYPQAFQAVQWSGAVYLAWLGFKMLMAKPGSAPAINIKPRHYLRQAMVITLLNPKAILFAAAFFPQFIQPGLPQWPQFAVLLATFAVIEVGWYLIYAASGQRLSHFLQRPSVMRTFNRVTGGVFIGFAALMALPRG
jgi:threonine/homoserine/homoserine lactone efflux protein